MTIIKKIFDVKKKVEERDKKTDSEDWEYKNT